MKTVKSTIMLWKSAANFLGGASALLLTTHCATAAPAADGNTWYAHDSGITGNFNSISASGDYVVAATSNGAIVEYKQNSWRPVDGLAAYMATSPFGTGSGYGNLRVATTADGTFWFGSYASQGNDARYLNGTFETRPRYTTARVISMGSYGSTIIMGLNAGRVTMVTYSNEEGAYRTVSTLPNHGNASIVAVAGAGHNNVWVTNGSKFYRSTNANASQVSWTELALPEYAGGVRAIGVPDSTSAYFGSTEDGHSYLFRWTSSEGFDASPLYSFGDGAFTINTIYVQDENNIWIGGSGGNLWFYDGSGATQIDLGTTVAINSITAGANGIWVAGQEGQIFSTVQPIPEPGAVALLGGVGVVMIGYARFATRRMKPTFPQKI